MTDSIKIDLRNLTIDMVKEALPYIGECRYKAPCIIGAMMTSNERDRCDSVIENGESSEATIEHLIERKVVEAPDDQVYTIIALQEMFDTSEWDECIYILGQYLPEEELRAIEFHKQEQ